VLIKKQMYYLYTFGCVLLLYFIATETISFPLGIESYKKTHIHGQYKCPNPYVHILEKTPNNSNN